MSEQHLHNKLGNAIGEAKKRFYKNLKDGADLKVAITEFMYELQKSLSQIVSEVKGDTQ